MIKPHQKYTNCYHETRNSTKSKRAPDQQILLVNDDWLIALLWEKLPKQQLALQL